MRTLKTLWGILEFNILLLTIQPFHSQKFNQIKTKVAFAHRVLSIGKMLKKKTEERKTTDGLKRCVYVAAGALNSSAVTARRARVHAENICLSKEKGEKLSTSALWRPHNWRHKHFSWISVASGTVGKAKELSNLCFAVFVHPKSERLHKSTARYRCQVLKVFIIANLEQRQTSRKPSPHTLRSLHVL